ncbi:ABC transporter ATP-binding protein [Guggenheimella bovis]
MTKNYSLWKNTKYFLRGLIERGPLLILSFFASVLVTTLTPIVTLLISKQSIELLLQKRSFQTFAFQIFLVFLALFALKVIASALSNYRSSIYLHYRQSFLSEFLEKVTQTDFQNIDGSRSRERVDKALNAIFENHGEGAYNFATLPEYFDAFLGAVLSLFVYVAIYLTLWPPIVLYIFIASILSYFYGRHVTAIRKNLQNESATVSRRLNYISQQLGDQKVVKDLKVYHGEEWFEEKYLNELYSLMDIQKRSVRKRRNQELLDILFSVLRDGLMYFYLIQAIINGTLSVDRFVFYFGLQVSLSQTFQMIQMQANNLYGCHLMITDYRSFIETDDRKRNAIHRSDRMKNYSIEFKHVNFTYPGAPKKTIEDLNLFVKPGEKVAIVGLNGAGKSTLVKLLTGLYAPDSGRILLDGLDSNDFSKEEYFKLFSVVFQDYHELPLSIETNITSDHPSERSVDSVIRLSGLDTLLDDLPEGKKSLLVRQVNSEAIDLSGGQKQKLQLAKAIYKDAPILILDEPTAALDPLAEERVYLSYYELSKDKTSIFISHRLSSTKFCDRILFFEDGKIVEQGTHEELLEKGGKYSHMFDVQSHYYKEEKNVETV